VVVAGASAGGVEALVALMRSLPPDLDAALLVVLHVSPTGSSLLPSILDRAADLPVKSAAHGDRLAPGHVYVAPPDRHLLIDARQVVLAQTPREHGHRPAIDPTMRAAAHAFGHRSVGIVLSGARDDGTAGLLAIKDAGGIAVVQDPGEALYPSMPRSAIDHVEVDTVLPATRMGEWLNALPAPRSGLRTGVR
jgi:two-component system, chemotaxis family, protein-glutamate methylesterase/glutaminase